ncbi:uncharacterized protein LOC143276108 [Babylonia areolata]|uniref:uncharacterized protein LOC143276108 n=1 Tax=Babylonia areolata TaxID=304850 RepID=UPI003FD1F2DA
MGDTVAHAARDPEDQDCAAGKPRVDEAPDTAVDGPATRNGDVLSVENESADAQPHVKSMEPDALPGGGDHDAAKPDSLTGNQAVAVEAENDKSVEEDLSFSKDGSSENISSIEIDTSVGNDLSFSASTNPGDDTSPEIETGPEIGAEQCEQNSGGGVNNSDSLNEINNRDFSTGDDDVNGTDTPTSDRSSSESGFVEGSTMSEDNKPSAAAHPVSVTAIKEPMGSSVTSGDTSVRCATRDLGILPRPPKATMEEEVQFLRQEVRQQSGSVQRLQTSLYDQQVRANLAVVALRTQLRKKERDMQAARGQHEQRMSALLSHLLYLEGQMRKEQRHVLELLTEKDDVIRRQKSAIEDLAAKNARLLAALKEVHGYSGGNGIAATTSTTPGSTAQEAGEGRGAVLGTPVVLRNKDKGQKVRFGSVKEKLKRHKSSLELHRPASLDTLVEGGTLRYGSQENLTLSPAVCRRTSEGLSSDEVKKTRQQERKERCKSLVDYPFRLNDLPEVSSEVEKGKEESPVPTDPLHHPHPHHLDQSLSRSPRTSQSCQQLSTPGQNRGSLYSDEEEAFLSPTPQDSAKQYGELAKASSMPQSLASPSDHDTSPANVKERPHSLSGVELTLNMDKMSMLPMERVSMNPSPTSLGPPGGSESNPFKSFKNVFRRRNSKQRSKKRPASLGQQTNQEYHEALKEHFKKYDLN